MTELERYIDLIKERPHEFKNSGSIYIEKNIDIIKNFEKSNNRKIGVLYESNYNILAVDLVYSIDKDNNKKYFAYERIIPKAKNDSSVVIVPIYNNKIILLKQYRHALRDYQYSLPRGYGEDTVQVEGNVRKELSEEIGATTTDIEFLGKVVPDSGLSGNKVNIYKCKVLEYNENVNVEGIEEIKAISIDKIEQMILNGEINDGFTISAINFLRLSSNKQNKDKR